VLQSGWRREASWRMFSSAGRRFFAAGVAEAESSVVELVAQWSRVRLFRLGREREGDGEEEMGLGFWGCEMRKDSGEVALAMDRFGERESAAVTDSLCD
jgi:hypothetical protein